jgi:hypothetical protein
MNFKLRTLIDKSKNAWVCTKLFILNFFQSNVIKSVCEHEFEWYQDEKSCWTYDGEVKCSKCGEAW